MIVGLGTGSTSALALKRLAERLALDADFGPIMDPVGLATQLAQRSGIVAHGLFLGLADEVIVGEEGRVQHLYRPT
jgi:ribose 5-phosphate isomerase